MVNQETVFRGQCSSDKNKKKTTPVTFSTFSVMSCDFPCVMKFKKEKTERLLKKETTVLAATAATVLYRCSTTITVSINGNFEACHLVINNKMQALINAIISIIFT